MAKKQESKYYFNPHGGMHGVDIATSLGRLAFVYLTKPNTKFAPPKYGVTLLCDKKDPGVIAQLKDIQALCLDMADEYCKELFRRETPNMPYDAYKASIMQGFGAQPILRDGDRAKYNGFADKWVIIAKNEKKQDITFLDSRLPEEFEAGIICRLQVQPYIDKKGFSYKLRGIKFVKDDGVRFKVAPDGGSLIKDLDDAVEATKINAADANVVGNGAAMSPESFENMLGGAAQQGASLTVL